MCVLAGCDFLPSVPGVGISRAHAFISKYQSVERVRIFFIRRLLDAFSSIAKSESLIRLNLWNIVGFVSSQDKKG